MLLEETSNAQGPTTNAGGSEEPMPKSFFRNLKSPKVLIAVFAVLIIVVALATLVFVASLNSKEKASQALDSGQQAILEGDFIGARARYEEGLKADSSNPKLLAGAILSIASQGNVTGTEADAQVQAQPYAQKAKNLKDKDVFVALGYLAETGGDYMGALNYYNQASALDASFAQAWFHKGHVLEFLGRADEAKEAYDKAYELDQNNAQVLLAKGASAATNGDLDGAYSLFIQAANAQNINPALKAEALTDASIVKRSQGYVQESLDLSKQAVDTAPTFSQGLSNHGLNLSMNGKAQEGVKYLEAAAKANERIAQPYWWLGLVERSVSQYDNAIESINTALSKLDNDNTVVGPEAKKTTKALMMYDLAKTYSLAGADAEAIGALEQAVQTDDKMLAFLKSDVENTDVFRGISQNERFLRLINRANI